MFGNEFEIKLKNELNQTNIARECAEWLKNKAEIKSLKFPNPAQPRLIHIDNPTQENVAISGTVDFTTDALGVTPSNRIDNNICMIGNAETQSFLQMFNTYWNNPEFVVDVNTLTISDFLKYLSDKISIDDVEIDNVNIDEGGSGGSGVAGLTLGLGALSMLGRRRRGGRRGGGCSPFNIGFSFKF